jgi:hypothetical protein
VASKPGFNSLARSSIQELRAMSKTAIRLGSAAALLLGVSAVVAQNPPPPPPPVPGGATKADSPGTPSTAYRVKQVLGTKVMIQGNVNIGTVDDIVFDDAGQVEYLIVDNGGKLVTIPWEAAKFNFEQRAATVNITQEVYRTIPTYTVQAYPQYFAPAYRTEVYKYYGIVPRPLRGRR